MTYIFDVTVPHKFVGGGIQLPAGLSVRVPYDSTSSPVYTTDGKQRIIQAFAQQCGIDLSRCPAAICSGYMAAKRM